MIFKFKPQSNQALSLIAHTKISSNEKFAFPHPAVLQTQLDQKAHSQLYVFGVVKDTQHNSYAVKKISIEPGVFYDSKDEKFIHKSSLEPLNLKVEYFEV